MATRKNTAHKGPVCPDFQAIFGRFSLALSLITVVRRAMDAVEIGSDEEVALRHGLALLKAVYDEVDRAIGLL